ALVQRQHVIVEQSGRILVDETRLRARIEALGRLQGKSAEHRQLVQELPLTPSDHFLLSAQLASAPEQILSCPFFDRGRLLLRTLDEGSGGLLRRDAHGISLCSGGR